MSKRGNYSHALGVLFLVLVLVATYGVYLWSLGLRGAKVSLVDSIPGLGKTITLQIEKFEPPLFLESGKLVSEGKQPEWMEGYSVTFLQNPMPFAEFQLKVSDEYLAENGIDQEKYEQSIQETKGGITHKATVFYTVEMECESGKYLFIPTVPMKHTNNLPPPNDVAGSLLKWMDGVWKKYPLSRMHAVSTIPWNNLSSLEQIIQVKNARLNEFGALEASVPKT